KPHNPNALDFLKEVNEEDELLCGPDTGFRRIFTPHVDDEDFSRGQNELKRIREEFPEESEQTANCLDTLCDKGVPASEFWALFVQCAKCGFVMAKYRYPYAHQCPKRPKAIENLETSQDGEEDVPDQSQEWENPEAEEDSASESDYEYYRQLASPPYIPRDYDPLDWDSADVADPVLDDLISDDDELPELSTVLAGMRNATAATVETSTVAKRHAEAQATLRTKTDAYIGSLEKLVGMLEAIMLQLQEDIRGNRETTKNLRSQMACTSFEMYTRHHYWVSKFSKAGLAEYGKALQSLGWRNESICVSNSDLPPPANVPGDQQGPLTPVWNIARQVLGGFRGNDPAPLLPDSSVADPASVGIAMLLANWTNLDSNDDQYERAARNQYNYLYSDSVPKTGEGAISHRIEEAQLWSDSIFMIPPFLAYYGIITDNKTVVQQAYDQIKLARDQLYDSNAGVWRDIAGGSRGPDPGYWATGNAWAAAGMLRVYATIEQSEFSGGMKNQKKDLKNWVREIHRGVYERYFVRIFAPGVADFSVEINLRISSRHGPDNW
ncbi:hypothetical protein EST38_g12804, partial [Candolleomyces aberdarensis]